MRYLPAPSESSFLAGPDWGGILGTFCKFLHAGWRWSRKIPPGETKVKIGSEKLVPIPTVNEIRLGLF
jgi:hypothetical protein